MAGTDEGMLINLDSPEKNCSASVHNHYLKNPLIPGPDLNCNELESNNPFDVVAQSAEDWDPFELVLRQSLKQHGKNGCPNNVERCDKLVDGEFPLSRDRCRLNRSNSVSNNVKFFPSAEQYYDKHEDVLNLSSRSLDNSPSLRERMKRVVKKHVGKCIEKALNGSSCQYDFEKVDSSKKYQNFTASSDSTVNTKNKLKDGIEDYNLHSFLEEAKQLSIILHNVSLNAESKFSPTKEYKISPKKGCKVSPSKEHKFSPWKECRISPVGQSKGITSCYEEDLMSIKPPWDGLENESSDSEDSSIGLPKVKLFYVKKKEKNKQIELDHSELAHYKKRIRASLDGTMSCDEDDVEEKPINNPNVTNPQEQLTEIKPVEKQDVGSERLKAMEPFGLLSANKPIVPPINDLRLKKVGTILKKGPLKAIVPLQKMTKTIAEKISPSKKTSRNNKGWTRIKGKDDSTLSSSLIYPVAASTPNSKPVTSQKKNYDTPLGVKSSSRLSRKDSDMTGSFRRSMSCTDSKKNLQTKQPFSAINPNNNDKWKRPHTAPSPNRHSVFYRGSPKSKNNDIIRNAKKLSAVGKENIMKT